MRRVEDLLSKNRWWNKNNSTGGQVDIFLVKRENIFN